MQEGEKVERDLLSKMKKKYRLLKKIDFKEVLSRGKKILSSNFVYYFLFDRTCANVRIGIVIPKKKCSKSWKRKYLKRFFWAFHANQNLLNFPKANVVFFYRDCFYKKFEEGNIDFLSLRNEYLKVIRGFSRE